MLTVEILISTLGSEGIQKVASMTLPQLEGVSYLVAWQSSDGCVIPPSLGSRSDVRVIANPGIGLSQNRNFALENARGEILVIADDDLSYLPDGILTIREIFAKDSGLDALLMRFRCDTGEYEKAYPDQPVILSRRYPKGYYVSSVEIALRRKGKAEHLRFDELMGIGAPVLKSGEEAIFIHQLIDAGGKVMLYPAVLCVHKGVSTGMSRVKDKGVYRGIGAVTSLLYPFSFPLRFVVMAARGSRRATMKFFPALANFFYGAFYYRTKVASRGRKEER